MSKLAARGVLSVLQVTLWSVVLAAVGCSGPAKPATPAAPSTAPPAAATPTPEPAQAAPLRIAYSDWPGWTAFEVGIQKGWFKEAGVNVEFSWFDYLPSMEAFSAGKVDAVTVTNGDALVTGANGAKSKLILVTDYSNGNDKVIAKPGIANLQALKGKKIGLELTLVEHLLLLQGLQKAGLKQSDVELVNFRTNETPQALASGQVDAVAAWYPTSSQALTAVTGAKAVWTSADAPGLIYDALAVSPQSLAQRKEDWAKVVKVWYRIVEFLQNPATHAEAVQLMAAKVGVSAAEYEKAMPGTYFLRLSEAEQRFGNRPGLDPLHGSTKLAEESSVAHKVYAQAQAVEEYIAGELTQALSETEPVAATH